MFPGVFRAVGALKAKHAARSAQVQLIQNRSAAPVCTPLPLPTHPAPGPLPTLLQGEDWQLPEQPVVSDSCRDLLSKMLVKDPRQRFTLLEVTSHPWFQEVGGSGWGGAWWVVPGRQIGIVGLH